VDRVAREVLNEHFAFVSTDSPFQAHARLAQAVWREWKDYPIGLHKEVPLGSRLAMPWAEGSLAAFLTERTRDLVRREVIENTRDRSKLFGRPRIFNDLLSSQPLCFNAFAELASDLSLAGQVGRELWPDLVAKVDRIELEWSPGRASATYLNNRSAFDVAWFCRNATDQRTFIGIEVKYHENMRVSAARHQALYDDLARSSDVFMDDALGVLSRPPLQQLWLDHLLALVLRRTDPGLAGVRFVLCAPTANIACTDVATMYRSTLRYDETFGHLSLDQLVSALKHVAVPAADELRSRYLPWTLPDYQPGQYSSQAPSRHP
jgi:hypothetical protein